MSVVTDAELGHGVQRQSTEAQCQKNQPKVVMDYNAPNMHVASHMFQIVKHSCMRHIVKKKITDIIIRYNETGDWCLFSTVGQSIELNVHKTKPNVYFSANINA